MSPLQILVSLVLLCGLGFLIYWAGLGPDAETTEAVTETVVEDNETDDILAVILNTSLASGDFFANSSKLGAIEKHLQELETTQELDETQKATVARIRLKNKSFIISQMLLKDIDCDAEKLDLFEFCEEHANSSDENLRRESQFELCSIPTAEFASDPTDKNFQVFQTAIQEHKQSYLANPDFATKLAETASALFKGSRSDSKFAKMGFEALATEMAKSELPEVQQISHKLFRLSAFGEFDLPSLRSRIAWKDPNADSDLQAAIEVLKKNPDSDFSVWIAIIHAYESFLATDEVEKVGALWQQMWSLSDAITNESLKLEVQRRLTNQKGRVIAIGGPFDFQGTRMPEGQPILTTGYDHFIIAFCDKGAASQELLQQIGADARKESNTFYTILAFNSNLEKDFVAKDNETAESVQKTIAIATNETSKKYFENFKVDLLPYMLLLNKQGKVVAANLQYSQAKNLITKMSKMEQKSAVKAP